MRGAIGNTRVRLTRKIPLGKLNTTYRTWNLTCMESALRYLEIAERELADLDALTLRMENSERSPNDKRALREHITIIRAVWSAMEKLDG